MLPIKPTVIDHLPGRTIALDGQEYLFFSGTSYLGMGHQAAFRAALTEGVAQYGTIFSASRRNNLQLAIYEQTEQYLSTWTGAEAALTVTSGMMAGQLAVHFLRNKTFFYAPGAHPAVWAESPSGGFNNYQSFNAQITELVAVTDKNKEIVIVSNSIDPLFCEHYNFDWIAQLPDNQDITLLIDDSHGIGILGENGAGIFNFIKNKIKTNNIKLIVIASMAKALGIPGGVILADCETIEKIKQIPLFVGASPIVPAYLYAFLQSQNVYETARHQLLSNIKMLEKAVSTEGVFRYHDNYPAFFSLKNGLYEQLFNKKIFISSFPYPRPDDAPITRVIVSALHTREDMQGLIVALSE